MISLHYLGVPLDKIFLLALFLAPIGIALYIRVFKDEWVASWPRWVHTALLSLAIGGFLISNLIW